MIKGQIKYYVLLMASVMGMAYLANSYADATTPTDTKAYDALNTAQALATNTDSGPKDSADATRKNSPSDYLHQIADNTYAFLKAFNYFSLNWLQIYTVPTSSDLDEQFGKYLSSSQENLQYQLAFFKGGSFQILGADGKPQNPPIKINSIYALGDESKGVYGLEMPSPDMSYASLLNNSIIQDKNPNDPESPALSESVKNAQYFVKNASGINIYHPAIKPKDKKSEDYMRYITFMNNIRSVASFNAYILNDQLADLRNNFKLSQTQTDLKNTASNPTWLKHVNNELSLGVILRQILLFNSQSFVIMSDLLVTQKQLLAATAMTNALIIANSEYNEKVLYDAARK